jgi:hypothetical protein
VGKRFSGVTESIQVSRASGGSRWLAEAAEGRGEGNEGSSAFHFPTSSCGSAARAAGLLRDRITHHPGSAMLEKAAPLSKRRLGRRPL